MPTFTLDTRGRTDAVLTARKLAQQFHRDLAVKSVLEIKPHELSWSDLAATKKSTVKTCRSLLDQVGDDTPSERAVQIETAFDLLNDLAKNLELEMDYRDQIGDRAERMDPDAGDTTEHSSHLDADGLTWVSGDTPTPDGFALRAGQPTGCYAKPKDRSEYRTLKLGNFMQAMVTGPKSDAERRALAENSDSSGGYNVPTQTVNELIDALRANLVVQAAGARVLPVGTDSVKIAKVATDPVPTFRTENSAVTESDPSFSAIEFVPRSCAVIVRSSRELLDDALNIGDAMRNMLASTLARTIDQTALEGTGVAPVPKGLRLQTGIGDVALNGALANYASFVTARKTILQANGGPLTGIIMSPRDEATLTGLVDSTGQPLQAPAAISAVPMFTTSSIQTDAGSGNDEANIYLGNFANLLIALRSDVRIEILRERYADVHQYAFLAHMRFDIGVSHPASFCKISGVQG